ncbi:PAS domain S-box protein [Flavobacterium pallidum]|uniref:histidine kinase n=1 Tax=Flavobacterium pallidum TaxID=2172098 RepID=A0A2S1SJY5_9FLAO|nr:PAS domain S-box protein [Flavobacterium pallidum]AWI26743.1 hypothetical protein HYN49_13040 [Flavobacterium pallidum]
MPNNVIFLPEGLQIINFNWQYIYLNDIALAHAGKVRKELIGVTMMCAFPGIETLPFFSMLKESMATREAIRFENQFVYENGVSCWFDLRVQPCDEGISIYSLDITERKEQENKLKKANELYALLTHISQKIVTVKDEDELFRDCCSLALRFGDFKMAWIGLFDTDLKVLTMVDQSGIPEEELALFHEALKKPNDQLAYIVKSGKYYISTDIQNDTELQPWRLYARKHSITSCILLPIRKSGQIIGLFSLYSAESHLSDDEITLLEQITTDISQALDIFEQVKKQQETQKLLLQHEQQFRYTLDHMIEGAQIHDFDWRYTYVNDALVKYTTYQKEELIGYTIMDKFPGIEQTPVFATLERCMRERISEKMETEFIFPDGSTGNFELSIQPVPEGLFILSWDTGKQLKAKEKLTKANRLYAFTSAINQNIVQINNEQELLDNICRSAYNIGGFKLAWIKLLDGQYIKRVSTAGTEEGMAFAARFSHQHVDDPVLAGTTTEIVLRSGKYTIINDVMNNDEMAFWKPYMRECGVQSSIALPIKKFGVTVGVFGLQSGVIDFFDKEETALLLEVADDISFALENFEKARLHKATEELLEKNERLFRALIEKSVDIKTLTTSDGQIIYGSPSLTKIMGYGIGELLHTSLLDLIHPDDLRAFTDRRNRIIGTAGATFNFQHRKKHKDGRWLWFEGSVTNMLNEPGIGAMVSNFRDITDKKLLEQQQEFDRNNLNALINNTNDLLWSIDRDYKLITSNLPFDEFVKKLSGKAVKKGIDVLKNSGNRKQSLRFRKFYERAFSGEQFTTLEHNTHPEEFWSEISFCPIRKGNEIIGAACHSRNITERIKAEHLLRQSDIFNRGILDSLSAHIAVVNASGQIITVNDSWRRFAIENSDSGLKSTSEGKNYFETFRNASENGDMDAANVLKQIKEVIKGTLTDFYYEYPCHSETEERWFSMLVRKFESDETLIVISHQDITNRKLIESQLLLNNESLQKTNNELDRFVYSVSHDLRSPLTSVLGLTGLIEAESKEEDTLLHIGMIKNSITRLDNFIRNILSYSRNNRTEVRSEEIRVSETVNEIVTMLSGAKEADGIRLEIDIVEDFTFYSDSQRFTTILENLISNAIKYHKKEIPDRFIKISGTVDEQTLQLQIEDNGIGIAKIHHAKIFDMFFRLANTGNGSGIGLYIVRESIEKMNGSIAIDSAEGRGTKFTITLKNLSHEIHS